MRGGEGSTIIQSFFVNKLDIHVLFKRRICQYCHVLEVGISLFLQLFRDGRKVGAARLSNRQPLIEVDRPFNLDGAGH